jgi:porphobilinogen synthase
MVRETSLSVDDFIMPLFVREGEGDDRPIGSMPGQSQLSVSSLVEKCKRIEDLGIPAVLLFGIPGSKDAVGSSSWQEQGIIQQSIRAIKKSCDQVAVITDLCFCEYTDHGHCGVLVDRRGRKEVDNDATVNNLVRQAISHAEAGADVIAPSDMMDGRVGAIRDGLDDSGYSDTPILSYAAKFSSGFYGPFRDAAESPPQFGDRKGYQMDFANAEEALREVALDIEEGADMVMVKPALAYLDLIWRVKQEFGLPTAAYNVSGEYSMIKAAAANGWLDEKSIALETLTAIKRAGADMILTYFAEDAAGWLS